MQVSRTRCCALSAGNSNMCERNESNAQDHTWCGFDVFQARSPLLLMQNVIHFCSDSSRCQSNRALPPIKSSSSQRTSTKFRGERTTKSLVQLERISAQTQKASSSLSLISLFTPFQDRCERCI